MRQHHVLRNAAALIGAALLAVTSAAAQGQGDAAKPAPPKVTKAETVQGAAPTAQEQQLQTRERDFAAARERYRELKRSGAPASQVDAQRQKMESVREQVRALREATCPNQVGRGGDRAGRGPGYGQGQGRGHGRGARTAQGPGYGQGQGRGHGPRAGQGPGHGQGQGRGRGGACQRSEGPGRHAGRGWQGGATQDEPAPSTAR